MKHWVIESVMTDRPLIKRAGRLQLSWLAAELQIDRQKFYLDRGPDDLQEVLQVLTSLAKLSLECKQDKNFYAETSGLRAALISQHKKIRSLQAEIKRLQNVDDSVHAGKAVVP